MSERYPEWYLEAIAGAERLREKGYPEKAQRIIFQATQAVLRCWAMEIIDSKGNLILEEEGSGQEF